MDFKEPIVCAAPGCGVIRRSVNNWFIVTSNHKAAHIYAWSACSDAIFARGKPFCGLTHAFAEASALLMPTVAKPGRESTLELKPLKNENDMIRVEEEQKEEDEVEQ